MKTVRLSPRLQAAADLVPRGLEEIWLADIGTDHAYLPVWLLQNQPEDRRLAHVVAADLRTGPLARARQTAREAGCEEQMEFRVCDGLRGLERREAQVTVIAGMGGETMIHILRQAPWSDWEGMALILQPMSSMPELRGWLRENGFLIREERLAREGEALYTVLSVRPGAMAPLSPAELWAGKNSGDPLRGDWLDLWIARTRRAAAGMARACREETGSRRRELEEVLEGLIRMKKEWEQCRQ